MASKFLWLDLETTGLDPYQGAILEVAAVMVDDDDPAMPVVEQLSSPVRHEDLALAYELSDPFVQKMHTDNGLWEACDTDGMHLERIEAALADVPNGTMLAGASVHFDLAWIRAHMPLLAARLSHRVLDVSSLKAAHRAWFGEFGDQKPAAHRALPDILASISEARALRALWAK